MYYFFFFFLFVIGYVYVGYPIIIFFISKLFGRHIDKENNFFPTVSLIIAAYNEEKVIDEKIKNSLALNYPKEKIEIIVFSDGSTDKTDAIVQSYRDYGIELFRIEGRKGKTYCQNEAVKKSSGEIIVFSDANSMYDEDALSELSANFFDPTVGVVCGELRYIKQKKSHEGLYWKIEKFLKKTESKINSCIGANGAIYAVRKELYEKLPDEIISDFIEPLLIYKKGYRVIYDAAAFCTEEIGDSPQEFNRKKRIILRSLQSLYLISSLLNPLKYTFFAFQVWSHKILRWMVPVFLLGIIVTNVFLLENDYFKIFLWLQGMFYLLAFVGKYNKNSVFSIPYYFCVINWAASLAIIDWLRGKKQIIWKISR